MTQNVFWSREKKIQKQEIIFVIFVYFFGTLFFSPISFHTLAALLSSLLIDF